MGNNFGNKICFSSNILVTPITDISILSQNIKYNFKDNSYQKGGQPLIISIDLLLLNILIPYLVPKKQAYYPSSLLLLPQGYVK